MKSLDDGLILAWNQSPKNTEVRRESTLRPLLPVKNNHTPRQFVHYNKNRDAEVRLANVQRIAQTQAKHQDSPIKKRESTSLGLPHIVPVYKNWTTAKGEVAVS